ncbi:PilZ domain-containing protein [Massilia sp. TWR1-2-2]|uniref:PilZ domain-containing protein n=1 Tax=Massilia sp. TWR1-2-2 TaxID=2804584 RepID=UPI003CE9972D
MFNEQRTSPRKVLKARALVSFDGAAPLAARTVDVGGNGLCLTYPQPMPTGGDCALSFEVSLEGKLHTIRTRSKALYCIFSNGEYKIGFQFLSLDLPAMTLLAKYMR